MDVNESIIDHFPLSHSKKSPLIIKKRYKLNDENTNFLSSNWSAPMRRTATTWLLRLRLSLRPADMKECALVSRHVLSCHVTGHAVIFRSTANTAPLTVERESPTGICIAEIGCARLSKMLPPKLLSGDRGSWNESLPLSKISIPSLGHHQRM